MLKPEDCVLVVIDVQGKLAGIMHRTEALHRNLSGLVRGAQLFDIPIVWLEQLPDKLGRTSESLRTVLRLSAEPIVKQHFSGWHCDAFRNRIEQLERREVLLGGIEAHVCVYQNCRDLLDNGYGVHLVADAVSSRTAENKALGVQMMVARGAQLTNLESLLLELQHEARGDRFRSLLRLIK